MSNSTQVKPSDLHKQCIKVVSKYVESHDALQFVLIDEEKGVFSLRNTKVPIVMDGKPLFYLLKVKNSKSLYIHISVTLQGQKIKASLNTNYEFKGISIQFFQGTGKPFCRAEWDVKKRKDKLEHPQPHWHWGGYSTIEEKTEYNAFSVSEMNDKPFLDEISDVNLELPAVDFEKLHYAMAAKWISRGKSTSIEDFNLQHLYDWLELCIGNVIDQYNYQVNKGGFVSSSLW